MNLRLQRPSVCFLTACSRRRAAKENSNFSSKCSLFTYGLSFIPQNVSLCGVVEVDIAVVAGAGINAMHVRVPFAGGPGWQVRVDDLATMDLQRLEFLWQARRQFDVSVYNVVHDIGLFDQVSTSPPTASPAVNSVADAAREQLQAGISLHTAQSVSLRGSDTMQIGTASSVVSWF
ncbi:MAG: hypothetical protein ACYCOR_19925 [Acidobacteriaceae bacterium]